MYETLEKPCSKCSGNTGGYPTFYDSPYEPSPTRIANATMPDQPRPYYGATMPDQPRPFYPGRATGGCTTGSAIVWGILGAALGFGIAMLILDVPARTVASKIKRMF